MWHDVGVATHPRGADTAVAPMLAVGEELWAATYASSFSMSDDVMSMIIGDLGRKATRSAGMADAPPPLPGLAGTIYRGEVLVAVTNQRVVVFPYEGKRISGPPTWYEPGAIVRASWSRAVLGAQKLELAFGDNTVASLGLPSSNHGKHVAKAAKRLLA